MLKAIHAQEDRRAAAAKAKTVVTKLTTMKLRKAATLVRESVGQTLLEMLGDPRVRAGVSAETILQRLCGTAGDSHPQDKRPPRR